LGQRRIAVVGAGVAGLTCAQALTNRGAKVTVFDENRMPGGRVASWATEFGSFDLGAQYFTVQTPRFGRMAMSWAQRGVIQPWPGRVVAFSEGRLIERPMSADRFVALPTMNDLARHLVGDIDLCLSTRIECIERRGGLWRLYADDGRALGAAGFDALLVAVPSPKAVHLLRGQTELVATIAAVQWSPCWVAMVALAQPSGADFDAAYINDDPILGWVSRDSAKPQRQSVSGISERWVLHAKTKWSQDYADIPDSQAGQWLLRALSARLGRVLKATGLMAYRWAHAAPINPLSQHFLWDSKRGIGIAGDWCGGPRIEDACLSGLALADAVSA